MTRSALLIAFCLWGSLPVSAAADKDKHTPIPTNILRSGTIYIDCSARLRAFAASNKSADAALREWGRFQILGDAPRAPI